jgi:hypothetical protein
MVEVKKNDKRFDPECHKKHDADAKHIAQEWLKQMGFRDIKENLKEAQRNFKEIWDVSGQHELLGEWRLEAEIKVDWGTKWVDEPFKYSTVDVPFRKRDKAEVQATHQMVIGGDHKRLFIVKREVMLDPEITQVTSKACRNRGWQKEPFYNIPIKAPHSSFWVKRNGRWKISK